MGIADSEGSRRDVFKVKASFRRIVLTVPSRLQAGRINLLTAQRREQHILWMVLSMVSCYMLCWMPYGIIALVATLGRLGPVSPAVSVVPSILAKFSTAVNPVIYVFFNNQVRAEICNASWNLQGRTSSLETLTTHSFSVLQVLYGLCAVPKGTRVHPRRVTLNIRVSCTSSLGH